MSNNIQYIGNGYVINPIANHVDVELIYSFVEYNTDGSGSQGRFRLYKHLPGTTTPVGTAIDTTTTVSGTLMIPPGYNISAFVEAESGGINPNVYSIRLEQTTIGGLYVDDTGSSARSLVDYHLNQGPYYTISGSTNKVA